jgi:homoserine O-acetyltransferase
MRFTDPMWQRCGATRGGGPLRRSWESVRFRALAVWVVIAGLLGCSALFAASYPSPQTNACVLKDFTFRSGETLPEVRMHYLTLGSPRRDRSGVVRNAILLLHGTTGSSSQFLRPEFANELFGRGQPLDATRYYIVIPDNIGHGRSSKPSDGLRARFPRYGYHDMIEAQRRLLVEGLKVDHLRLLIGTSMGGMHAWLWGQEHPQFMDGLIPLASLPVQVSGRNRVWRKIIIDSIRNAPDWQEGNYEVQPRSLSTAVQMLYFMGSNPVLRWQEAPTLAQTDAVLSGYVTTNTARMDANDVLYAVEASHDYDPEPGLAKIRAPLLAINFADDLINPPELGILESQIRRVPRGRAILVPYSKVTRGHGTHTTATVWKKPLQRFLRQTERKYEFPPSP